jgi:glycerol-3-phosphate acyltransferase PlsY
MLRRSGYALWSRVGGNAVSLEPVFGPLLALLLGYLLGSIPFGLLLTRVFGAGDLRTIGSGNIGATNVLRTGHKRLAAATLLLDVGKGAVAVLLGHLVAPGGEGLAAIGAFFGHLFPLWLRFQGGKGVAIFLGLALALHWPVGIAYAFIWLAVLAIGRISSLAGMAAGIFAPVAAAAFGRLDLAILFLAFALLLLWKHRANIGRLIGGTEPRVGQMRRD